jgi:hypothetical protein
VEIEVIASGRGSVTIKTETDLPKRDILHLTREATKLTERIVTVTGGKKVFGFEAAARMEASELAWDPKPKVLMDPEGEH